MDTKIRVAIGIAVLAAVATGCAVFSPAGALDGIATSAVKVAGYGLSLDWLYTQSGKKAAIDKPEK